MPASWTCRAPGDAAHRGQLAGLGAVPATSGGATHLLGQIEAKQHIARELIAEYEAKFPDDVPDWFDKLEEMANWQPGDRW